MPDDRATEEEARCFDDNLDAQLDKFEEAVADAAEPSAEAIVDMAMAEAERLGSLGAHPEGVPIVVIAVGRLRSVIQGAVRRAAGNAIAERLAAARPRAGTGYDAGNVAACEEILREIRGG